MHTYVEKVYPNVLQAVHLVILYIFIQTVVDFPLALIDYYKDTEYLYYPLKKIILGIGSTLFILYYGYRKSRVRLIEVFPLKKFNLFLLIPITAFLWGMQNVLNPVNAALDKIIPPPSWFFELFNKIFESDYGWLGAFMKVAVIAPIVEELIFRGVIMRGFMKNYPGWLAVLYSALLFALFHLNPWQFPATFILGLILGWLMLSFRNIILCILGHSINNLLVLLSITFWEKVQNYFPYNLNKNSLVYLSIVVIFISLIFIAVFVLMKQRKTVIIKGN